MKKKKIIGWVLGVVLAIVVVLIGVSEYFIYYALHHDHSDYNVEEEFKAAKENCPWTAEWLDSIRSTGALKDTFIVNREGLKMHGWYLSSPDSTANTAVIVHGYTSNPIFMTQIGYMYNNNFHWNILLPDLVAHGMSEGSWVQMGWKDRLDVIQWIGVANELFPNSQMVVHGISMGAATTMCVSGEDTPDYVRAFVDDCGYTSVWDEFSGEMKNQFHIPASPLLDVVNIICKIQLGWSFKEASPLKQVAKCKKPMLFIHGDNDDYVPTAMVHPLYEAKQGEKQLWLAPGSAHAESYKDHHEEYTKVVKDFLERNL